MILCLATSGLLPAQEPQLLENFPVPDDEVTAVAVSPDNGAVYIGGAFRRVGPFTGSFVGIDAASGVWSTSSWAKINGDVFAVESDGAGGWFVGGKFTKAGAVTRNNLVHLLPDGSVDPAWNPAPNDFIDALGREGTTLYVGGGFTQIGGQPRERIAALSTSTGAATPWNPGSDGVIECFAPSGPVLYVGGEFQTIGGATRPNLAALDTMTGAATAWNPSPDGQVNVVLVSGSTVYIGGEFQNVGATSRAFLAAIDAATGLPTAWHPVLNGNVSGLDLDGATIFAAGEFASVGADLRRHCAEIDLTTGAATAFNPDPGDPVNAVLVDGSSVYLGGEFRFLSFPLISRGRLARVDKATGALQAWDPSANKEVITINLSGANVFAGGRFSSVNGELRAGIAAINTATGALVPGWDPGILGGASIEALSATPAGVYAAGSIFQIGGAFRDDLAEIDAASGLATAWNPDAPFFFGVKSIAVTAGEVYASGLGISAVNRISGAISPWDPAPNSVTYEILVSGSTVFAGGEFTKIGGADRNRIAAVSTSTAGATSWNPGANDTVSALALDGTTLFTGGDFSQIGGAARNAVAALSTGADAALPWNPMLGAGAEVFALQLHNAGLYVGGRFASAGGVAHPNIVALDPITGGAASWNPGANEAVDAFAIGGTTLYVGGNYSRIADGRSFFAAFAIPAGFPGSLAPPSPTPAPTPNPTPGAPVVTVLGKKKIKTDKPKAKIKGTASPAEQIASVEYKIGKKKTWKKARGTATWKIKAKLTPGKNKITIQARALDGQVSAPAKVKVLRQ